MELDNVECRSSRLRSCSEISYFENNPTGLGETEAACRKHGANKVVVGGKDCRGRNSFTPKQSESNSFHGEVIDQLASEIEKEISYHKSQVDDLEGRLNELRKLSGELGQISNSE